MGLKPEATKKDIKLAFVRLAKKYHPDKDKSNENKFKEINKAYSVLSDQNKRKEYDDFRKFGGGGTSGPSGPSGYSNYNPGSSQQQQ